MATGKVKTSPFLSQEGSSDKQNLESSFVLVFNSEHFSSRGQTKHLFPQQKLPKACEMKNHE